MVVVDGQFGGLTWRKDFRIDGEIANGVYQGLESDAMTAAETGEQGR